MDTAAGVMFGKLMCIFGRKVNPLIGAAGGSAFPMSARRVVQKFAQEEDFTNFSELHAMDANTASQIGSVMTGRTVIRNSSFGWWIDLIFFSLIKKFKQDAVCVSLIESEY